MRRSTFSSNTLLHPLRHALNHVLPIALADSQNYVNCVYDNTAQGEPTWSISTAGEFPASEFTATDRGREAEQAALEFWG